MGAKPVNALLLAPALVTGAMVGVRGGPGIGGNIDGELPGGGLRVGLGLFAEAGGRATAFAVTAMPARAEAVGSEPTFAEDCTPGPVAEGCEPRAGGTTLARAGGRTLVAEIRCGEVCPEGAATTCEGRSEGMFATIEGRSGGNTEPS